MTRVDPHVVRLQRQLSEALKCGDCGKRIGVANANLAGYQRLGNAVRFATPEKVTRETHCTCAGGPAALLPEKHER